MERVTNVESTMPLTWLQVCTLSDAPDSFWKVRLAAPAVHSELMLPKPDTETTGSSAPFASSTRDASSVPTPSTTARRRSCRR